VAVRRGTDATASRGPRLTLDGWRRSDGRGGPDLEPRRTDSRRRAVGRSGLLRLAIAPAAQHDVDLAEQMVAVVTQPERGVLPQGRYPSKRDLAHLFRVPSPPSGSAPESPRAGAWTDSEMQGGPVDELLGVAVERPALDQLEVEVGRTLEDRVLPV